MSKWHQFEVRQYDLRDAGVELRDLYKQTFHWLAANANGKWKVSRLRGSSKPLRIIPIRTFLLFTPLADDTLIVSLKKERDVTLFKLFFSDYRELTPEVKFQKVLISLVRRSVPTLIANSIIGVQPMTGKTSAVFALKTRYVDQNNPNNRMFGGSPSKRRAQRKRLRKQGVVFTATQMSMPQQSLSERYGS